MWLLDSSDLKTCKSIEIFEISISKIQPQNSTFSATEQIKIIMLHHKEIMAHVTSDANKDSQSSWYIKIIINDFCIALNKLYNTIIAELSLKKYFLCFSSEHPKLQYFSVKGDYKNSYAFTGKILIITSETTFFHRKQNFDGFTEKSLLSRTLVNNNNYIYNNNNLKSVALIIKYCT